MCEKLRPIESGSLPHAAQQRFTLLIAWIAADDGGGDYTTSLRLWRDEVVTRIPKLRPQFIKIPSVFITRLGLAKQRVLIDEDDAVYEMIGDKKGRLLVPGCAG